MRVKHYPRVSSIKQAKLGDSVEFQETRLNQDSELKGDEIVEVVTDAGKSASVSDDKIRIFYKEGIITCKIDIRKRTGMNKILASLKEDNWDALKVTKWDRFSRNNIVTQLMLLYFKNHGKEIIAVDDSNEAIVRDIASLFGQAEIIKNKQRVRDSRLLRFQNGHMVGRPPFGYKSKKDKRGKVIGMIFHPRESEIVSDAFKMTSEGYSYSEICKKHKIKPQTYYNIIRNKVYMGIIQFEGKEKEGKHPPLVSKELWEKVNSLGK